MRTTRTTWTTGITLLIPLSARINQVQEDLVAQITALKKDILDRLPHPVQASQNLGQLGPQQMAGPLHDYVHGQSQQQGEPLPTRNYCLSFGHTGRIHSENFQWDFQTHDAI